MNKATYFNEKYGMTTTHSAVVEAVEKHHIAPTTALDLGCGQGRNALYLALHGFEVTASDWNMNPQLTQIAQLENLEIKTENYDINQANLSGEYGLIVATVVFMFLQRERVPAIIANMQAHTQSGGYNLVVSAMDTADFPCHMPFSFTFKEHELREYYADWDLLDYREEVGSMHARDAHGNPVQLKFVTMLAQKP